MHPDRAAKARGVGRDSLTKALKREGFDWGQARRDRQRREREARVAGRGNGTCTSCGKSKSWLEFGIDTDRHGVQRRRRICRACASKRSSAYYQANRAKGGAIVGDALAHEPDEVRQ
jgi:hypothetical protein